MKQEAVTYVLQVVDHDGVIEAVRPHCTGTYDWQTTTKTFFIEIIDARRSSWFRCFDDLRDTVLSQNVTMKAKLTFP